MNITQSPQEKLKSINREKKELEQFLENEFGHPSSVNGAILNRLSEINIEIKGIHKVGGYK